MASQTTKNRPMKMTLRRLLLAISLYTRRILWHRRHPDLGAVGRAVRAMTFPQAGRTEPRTWCVPLSSH